MFSVFNHYTFFHQRIFKKNTNNTNKKISNNFSKSINSNNNKQNDNKDDKIFVDSNSYINQKENNLFFHDIQGRPMVTANLAIC